MTHSQAARLASLEIALAAFRQQFPTYDTTHALDTLRVKECARLDTQGQVNLPLRLRQRSAGFSWKTFTQVCACGYRETRFEKHFLSCKVRITGETALKPVILWIVRAR
jgi:hypothetical protein